MMSGKAQLFDWTLRIIAAIIFLQTLFFKFTASEESVYIFSTLGTEPYGRIFSGIAELIAAILLLVPKTVWYGAVLGMAILGGAIISHIFVLGIEVRNDGGLLFTLAIIAFLSCAVLALRRRIYNKN